MRDLQRNRTGNWRPSVREATRLLLPIFFRLLTGTSAFAWSLHTYERRYLTWLVFRAARLLKGRGRIQGALASVFAHVRFGSNRVALSVKLSRSRSGRVRQRPTRFVTVAARQTSRHSSPLSLSSTCWCQPFYRACITSTKFWNAE